jgi:2-polyprenyl-3-methyl-5-hydroxy-6-metoxy-1,4-benzoquinol methylase
VGAEAIRITSCRVCSSDALRKVLSLGNQYLADFPETPKTDKPRIELSLVFCEKCNLVQLEHTTNPDLLFQKFWYRSGINEMMREALHDIVIKSSEKVNLQPGEAACDIGCNDGTMLSMFPKSIFTVGFDPSDIVTSLEAKSKMKYSIHNYFNKKEALDIAVKIGKRFKLITAIAMFYDLNDPAEFLNDCKTVMTDDGMLVIQMNYLMSMIKNNAIDNICHEHLTYFSLTSLKWLLNKVGLEVVDVETNDVNGGSFRVYVKKIPITSKDVKGDAYERIKNLLKQEKEFGIDKATKYIEFGQQVKRLLQKLVEVLTEISIKGNPVYAYGASTRGTVLLQSTPYPLPLAGVAERDSNKFGKYMVSNWLNIHDEDYVRNRAKFMLVLPWHFKDGIVEREKEWLSNGGTLIFPLPQITLVTKDGETIIKENQNASVHSA